MNSESKNICNMPKLMNIEVYQSEETGKFYIEFIDWYSKNSRHIWQDKNITEEQLFTLLTVLYPLEAEV